MASIPISLKYKYKNMIRNYISTRLNELNLRIEMFNDDVDRPQQEKPKPQCCICDQKFLDQTFEKILLDINTNKNIIFQAFDKTTDQLQATIIIENDPTLSDIIFPNKRRNNIPNDYEEKVLNNLKLRGAWIYIELLCVNPKVIRRGIGKLLLQIALLNAWNTNNNNNNIDNALNAILRVAKFEENSAANHLYLSMGFSNIVTNIHQINLGIMIKYDLTPESIILSSSSLSSSLPPPITIQSPISIPVLAPTTNLKQRSTLLTMVPLQTQIPQYNTIVGDISNSNRNGNKRSRSRYAELEDSSLSSLSLSSMLPISQKFHKRYRREYDVKEE